MKTPFYDNHKSFGAKMLNFHGWEMPVQYSGIIDVLKLKALMPMTIYKD